MKNKPDPGPIMNIISYAPKPREAIPLRIGIGGQIIFNPLTS
jgi:hypothetical protein